MDITVDKEWFEKRAKAEGDLEIGAGSRKLTSTINLTPEEIAEMERLAMSSLPQWAQDKVAANQATIKALTEALEQAGKELFEAADKMNVFGINHPGGLRHEGIRADHLNEDKAHMMRLAGRFVDASEAAMIAIATCAAWGLSRVETEYQISKRV